MIAMNILRVIAWRYYDLQFILWVEWLLWDLVFLVGELIV